MKYGQKLKLRDAHVTPRNIQGVKASNLGDAQGIPSSSTKYQVIFHLLYFYCFICYVLFLSLLSYLICFVLFWSVVGFCFVFCFVFVFLFFVLSNKGWTPSYLFWRRHTPF